MLRHGLQAAFGFPIYSEGKLQAVLEFLSTTRQPPDKELLCIVQSLGEQLGRVIERRQSQAQTGALEAILDALTLAVYFTDRSGRVVYMNRAAEQEANTGGGLCLEKERLVPVDRTARVAFARALDRATADKTCLPTSETILPLPAQDDGGLIAVILPLQGSEHANAHATLTETAAVLVQGSVPTPFSTGEAFAQLYGLTKSELRVLLAMAPGLRLKEVAERLGICETTAKTHVMHVYDKTGTSKQSELVHLLMRFASPVRIHEQPRPSD